MSGRIRVLIVDEHAPSRFVLCYGLRQCGYVCDDIADAASALASIESTRPDVIILEWALQNATGIGLAARLRARSQELGRPLLIVVVSFADEPSDFRAREDVDVYLTKPVTVAALDAVIRRTRSLREIGPIR